MLEKKLFPLVALSLLTITNCTVDSSEPQSPNISEEEVFIGIPVYDIPSNFSYTPIEPSVFNSRPPFPNLPVSLNQYPMCGFGGTIRNTNSHFPSNNPFTHHTEMKDYSSVQGIQNTQMISILKEDEIEKKYLEIDKKEEKINIKPKQIQFNKEVVFQSKEKQKRDFEKLTNDECLQTMGVSLGLYKHLVNAVKFSTDPRNKFEKSTIVKISLELLNGYSELGYYNSEYNITLSNRGVHTKPMIPKLLGYIFQNFKLLIEKFPSDSIKINEYVMKSIKEKLFIGMPLNNMASGFTSAPNKASVLNDRPPFLNPPVRLNQYPMGGLGSAIKNTHSPLLSNNPFTHRLDETELAGNAERIKIESPKPQLLTGEIRPLYHTPSYFYYSKTNPRVFNWAPYPLAQLGSNQSQIGELGAAIQSTKGSALLNAPVLID